MATNGIVSLVKNGQVAIKCIAGCNGTHATEVADWLRENRDACEQEVYDACIELGFGCEDCLVVQGPVVTVFLGGDDLGPLYRKRFSDPSSSPRWDSGIAACVEVVVI
jgi:hypothetical protein